MTGSTLLPHAVVQRALAQCRAGEEQRAREQEREVWNVASASASAAHASVSLYRVSLDLSRMPRMTYTPCIPRIY